MRILIAPDKMKGALAAIEFATIVADALRRADPAAECICMPIADGGEGSADILEASLGGERISCRCHDALGRVRDARWLWVLSRKLAFVEMSEASGLKHIAHEERDPLHSSTFGTGELMANAIEHGAERICVGLGGSATNDAGAGMAAALGWDFLSSDGEPTIPCPANFLSLVRVRRPERSLPRITAACDVTNPLLGPEGATKIYGPQKGATPETIPHLEMALEHLADLLLEETGKDHRDKAGAGAAGGTAFGLLSFCDADLVSGFDLLADAMGLESAIAQSDVVITGEGSLDHQSLSGKGPSGVAALARKHGKPVFAFAGRIEDNPRIYAAFNGAWAISPLEMPLSQALSEAPSLLNQAVSKATAAIFSSAAPASQPF